MTDSHHADQMITFLNLLPSYGIYQASSLSWLDGWEIGGKKR